MQRFPILLIVLLSLATSALGKEPSLPRTDVIPFPLLNELPSNTVGPVVQDSDGYIWLGTSDGLSRYDGHRTKTWRSDHKNPSLLSDNDISSLAILPDGDLLIGTQRGLNRMDAARKNIRQFTVPDLAEYQIRWIVPDDNNEVWIGTYKRLVKYHEKADTVQTYDKSLPITSVNYIFKDNAGDIWVSFWKKGLFKYDRAKDSFHKIHVLGDRFTPMRMMDVEGGYLVSTWGEGLRLLTYDESGAFINLPVEVTNDDPSKVSNIYGLTKDRYGNIWMVGQSGILSGRLVGSELRLHDISSVENQMNCLYNRLFPDRENNIWVPTNSKGVFILSNELPAIAHHHLPEIKLQGERDASPSVTAIHKFHNRLLFNISQGGLTEYSQSTGYRPYTDNPSLGGMIELKEIEGMKFLDSDTNSIYILPKFHPYVYKLTDTPAGLSIAHTYSFSNIHGGAPRSIAKDSKGNTWVACDRELDVILPDGRVRKVKQSVSDIKDIAVDGNDNLWIVRYMNGVQKLSLHHDGIYLKAKIETVPGLRNLQLEDAAMDHVGKTLLVASRKGNLITIDTETGTAKDISEDLHIAFNERLQDIVVDVNGNKWISTSKTVYRFSPDFSHNVQIPVSGGDAGTCTFNNDAVFYDKPTNTIYYGTTEGYVTVDASDAETQGAIAVPLLTDVKIAGESVMDDESDGLLDSSRKEIVLPSDARDIQFEFSTFHYTHGDEVSYSYRLSGVDKDWTTFNNGKPIAFYNKLPSGTFNLEVRASDSKGEWSEPTVYKVKREAAWWQTWWAYSLYVILFLTACAILYFYIKRRIAMRKAITQARLEKRNTEELTEMKLKYFANISHDFLTPITIINCLVDDMEITYGKIGPHLDKIRFNLAKTKRLIQQIIDYRKVESGNMRLKVSQGDLCDFIDQICRNHFLPLMESKHINFSYNQDCEPILGFFDADKVEKVVFNLVSNAFKYTPDGGTISLNIKSRKIDGQVFAIITVTDNGKGISQKDKDKVFNRFYTVDGSRSESNGIGLSLVKDLTELHHGKVSVESEPGKGSTFTVEFPVSRECFTDDEMAGERILSMTGPQKLPQDLEILDENSVPPSSDIKLLIVEDNEELLSVMAKIFSRNYQVMIAHDGLEALDMIGKNDIDIIVSDVMMPGMDGLELCNRLKSDIQTSHIPVILLTAKNRPEDRVDCYNAGADGYIAKPFELRVLAARITNFLNRKHSEQEKFKEEPEADTSVLEMSPLDKEFIQKVDELINAHMDDDQFDIDSLADEVCMSRSSLYRKIKVITGMSPVELVRTTKLKKSYELLKEGRMNISQVAYATGFSNPKYFSTCFKEQFGMSPREVQKG